MPQIREVPYISPLDLDSEPVKALTDLLSAQYALSLVNLTFHQYETFRTQNHDKRWNTHDALFYGYIPQKVWEGTSTPRSSLSIKLVFDQLQSALPAISQALFGAGQEFFDVTAEPGTDPQEAKDIQDALAYILDHPKDEVGTNALSEIELAIINLLLYGNGGIAVEWDPILRRPVVEWVDIRDVYIDSGLSTPNFDESRAIIRRRFFTVSELSSLREDDRFKIPSDDELWTMARSMPNAPADQTKSVQEALRGINFVPGSTDRMPNPGDQKIEVLVYTTKNKVIWVLNRQHVAFNDSNVYGFQPLSFAPCYIVPGRAYGMSIGDVQEENQRYIEGLLNGRLDQITLDLSPPRAGKRGSLMTPAQQRWKPGAYYQVDNPKEDMQLLQPSSNLTNVFTDIQYIQSLADGRTGINSLGGSGTPRPSNANRTLGGMQMQVSGGNNRITHIVGNIERYMLVPMLYKLHRILQFHTRPDQEVAAQKSDAQRLVPGSTIQKRARFKMNAASKMLTKEKLMTIVPFIEQTLLQGQLVNALHSVGKTIDFNIVAEMIQDAAGIENKYVLVRDMNDQEKQAQNQPSPADQQKQQQAQADNQVKLQLGQQKVQGDLQKAQIMKAPSAQEMQAEQMKQQMIQQAAQQSAQLDMAKAQQQMQADAQDRADQRMHDAAMNKIKLEAEQRKHQFDMAKHGNEMRMQHEENQMNQQTSVATHQMKMQQIMEQLQMKKAQNTSDIDNSNAKAHSDVKNSTMLAEAKAEAVDRKRGSKDRPPENAQVHKKTAGRSDA